MPCHIDVNGEGFEVSDEAILRLIGCALNVAQTAMIQAVEAFNSAEEVARLGAIKAFRQEPWRAYLAIEEAETIAALAAIGLRPVVDLPPLRPLGKMASHPMMAGCGGDGWGNQVQQKNQGSEIER